MVINNALDYALHPETGEYLSLDQYVAIRSDNNTELLQELETLKADLPRGSFDIRNLFYLGSKPMSDALFDMIQGWKFGVIARQHVLN